MMNSLRLLILNLLFLFYSMYNCEDACSSKLCKCKIHDVDCRNKNLTYIPVFPNETAWLLFDFNNIPLINEHTISNISHLRLKTLSLQHCNISHITTNTFKEFTFLRRIVLSYNPLGLTQDSLINLFSDLRNSFYSSLNFQQIGLKVLPEGLFKKHNITVKYIDFSKNFLKILNFTEFNTLNLTVLKVENNSIDTIIIDEMKHLRNLSLKSNKIVSIPNFCHKKSHFSSLIYLDFENNSICYYQPQNMNCLTKLSKLIMHYNCISLIGTGFFQELSSLKELSVSRQKNSQSHFRIEKYAFNNSNIESLLLFDNILNIKYIDPLALSGCDGVTKFLFSGNFLRDSHNTTSRLLDQVLSKLTSLQHLDLRQNKLTEVPKSIQKFTDLRYLTLYHNAISTWKGAFGNGNKKLIYLDLGKNSIRKISQEMLTMRFMSQLKTLSLQNNTLDCICENVWLIEMMNRDPKKFQNFPVGYNCLNMTRRVCLRNNPIYTSITGVSCVLLLIFIVVSVVFKYRWFIKYQIYIWRHQPKLLNNMAERQYLYDVFVSYSVGDAWVLDHLVPQLEENEGMKLCIHERDFQAGRLIIDNIVESIENSRRVLIILSNNFARSEWCQFEMTLAQKNVLNRAMEPLSVVLLEEIDSENMSNSLHVLLKTTTYITWYNDDENINLFWDRLKNSLI